MVSNKAGYTSQLAGFDSSQAAAFRYNKASSNIYGNSSGTSTPTMTNLAATGSISNTNIASNNGGSQQVQVSAEAKMLIRTLLTVDEAQRPSALEVLLQSQWVQAAMTADELASLGAGALM